MTLKNDLQKAQATLEYFILFGLIAVLTILAFTSLDERFITILEGDVSTTGLFERAVNKIYNGTSGT